MKKFAAPLLSLGAVLLIVLIVGGIKTLQFSSAGANFAPPPVSISVFEATTQTWPSTIEAIGSVRADEGITIYAEVPGTITQIHFNSGDHVKAGQLLVEQESGNEQAALDAALARLRLADYNFTQIDKLRSKNTVSENQYETAKQELESARANVANLTSSLQKKQIKARFSGKLGISKVDLGEDLRAGTPIVSLHSHEQLKVNFPIPQRWLAHVKSGQQVRVQLLEGEGPQVSGTINAIDSAVNEVTRSIEVEAMLDDANGALIPGMAVKVDVSLPKESQHLVIPSTAIIYAPFGDTVFVVEENKETGQLIARQQFIQVDGQRGDFASIKAGLKPGERVASAGAFKLYNGQSVTITEQPEVTYSLFPTPSDS